MSSKKMIEELDLPEQVEHLIKEVREQKKVNALFADELKKLNESFDVLDEEKVRRSLKEMKADVMECHRRLQMEIHKNTVITEMRFYWLRDKDEATHAKLDKLIQLVDEGDEWWAKTTGLTLGEWDAIVSQRMSH